MYFFVLHLKKKIIRYRLENKLFKKLLYILKIVIYYMGMTN